ncbi:MAG TPA: M56 family metallopeptidase [Pseudonocardiaceae bacterium]
MIVSIYLPLVLPVLVVPMVRWLCGRLHPALASWLAVVSGLVLCFCAFVVLGLLTFVSLSTLSVFARFGHWSPTALQELDLVHQPIDLAAGALLAVFLTTGIVAACGRLRALAGAYRAARRCRDGGELTVVVDDRPLAHALPGRPGRIVVSTSMLAVLTPAQRRALLAHEQAHLDRRHHLFVAVIDVLAAANPLLRPLAGTIRFTTERWADEIAAGRVGDRTVVAQAVGRAALAGRTPSGGTVAMAATAGPVPRRVTALLTAPPVARLWSVLLSPVGLFTLVVLGLVVGSAMFSADAAYDLRRALVEAKA